MQHETINIETQKINLTNHTFGLTNGEYYIVPNTAAIHLSTMDLGWGAWSNWTNLLYVKIRSRTTPYKVIMEYNYQQDLYFKLKENLLYKLNHHLDIDFKNSETRVQIQIELEPENVDDSYYLSDDVLGNSNNNLTKTKN